MPGEQNRASRQKTLDGFTLPPLPKVRTSTGHIIDWDRERIVRMILKESLLLEEFYGGKAADEELARDIARNVEQKILKMGLKFLSGPLIREILNITLIENDLHEYRNVLTRVGTPVYDAHMIDVGKGFESKDNANLQENAETSHKKKADKISKEQYLLQLPPELADYHLRGDMHIHDLEYFGTRPFCIDGSTVIPMRSAGRIRSVRPDELLFSGDTLHTDDLELLTKKGWACVDKVTRRKVNDGELIRIKTSGGRSLSVTKEHRIPVQKDEGMVIRKAEEIVKGDILYAISDSDSVRGEPVSEIDLIHELITSVPDDLLEGIYVRGAGEYFSSVVEAGEAESFQGISEALGITHQKQWYSRGIMPIRHYLEFCNHYGIAERSGITVGATGSTHDLPAILPVTPDLMRLLGFFVSEGNYNAYPEKGQYNLAITENHQSAAIQASVTETLNTFATVTQPVDDITTIYGVEVEKKRALQVYFGGKLVYLLFRFVFNIPEGSVQKRLPWIVYHADNALLREFLSALFTGDGSAYYRPEKSDCIVNYTTASESLRQELSLLLTSLGINPHITELYSEDSGRRTLYRVQFQGRKNVEIFSEYASFLDERQAHIDNFIAGCHEIKKAGGPERVVSVEPDTPSGSYVYDFFLKGDGSEESHTFFASDGLLIHNCQDWDLRYFFYYGLMPDGNGTKASVAGPAKRAEVAVLHAVKALGSAQTNFAGGQGYYNFLTFLAPYFEGLDYESIMQLMQMFVYEMTQMMVARGGQVVFSSVQLSPGVPKLWKDKPCIYKGKIWDGEQAPLKVYGDFEKEVRLLFRALMEVMLEGDYWGKPFNFPKPEVSIEPDFMEEDEEFNRNNPGIPSYRDLYLLTFELASKYGTPYYDNQIPAYRGAGEGISCYQCCAYQFSSMADDDDHFDDKLIFKDGKHFSMGSWQVVSVNCPRAAYKAEGSDEALFSELKRLMDVATEIFKIKRRWMDNIRAKGRMPFAMQRPKDPNDPDSEIRGEVAVDLEGLVYTVGIVGVNEMVKHHTGYELHENREAFKLAVRAMTEMELYAKEISSRQGMTIALARTPAETTGQRFAVADLIEDNFHDYAADVVKGDLKSALENLGESFDLPVYYTNGTHVSPGADVTLTKRMEIEHVFFPIVDGGNIFHIWLGEARPDPRGLMDMAMNLCKNTQIGYFAFTRDLTVSLKQFTEYKPEDDKEPVFSPVDSGIRV
ncbi:anaerobic ribonucleoside-triphosphate reductase [Methanoplanus limicola]|uniref:Ribonucleoside-triphosphate reductase class III catalytic subunit n=1 Tax=Methanoplanus limicola DSM 2279 TaxID=937775 RepID=H1YYC7_9EURY|nr:anaerobic ribonucleoside-triphosphate reductase [Methanoplanus limicola]EHQ34222.1 ribonucleoside-triphosphate reductase class III catalytic subunit [Methanoplanus limicola DSM 2279]